MDQRATWMLSWGCPARKLAPHMRSQFLSQLLSKSYRQRQSHYPVAIAYQQQGRSNTKTTLIPDQYQTRTRPRPAQNQTRATTSPRPTQTRASPRPAQTRAGPDRGQPKTSPRPGQGGPTENLGFGSKIVRFTWVSGDQRPFGM